MPTFGYTLTGDVKWPLIGGYIVGSKHKIKENGVAQSISAYLSICSVTHKVKCAIYSADRKTKIGETEEKTIDSHEGHCNAGWFIFNLLEPKPTLVANAEYFLVAWGKTTATEPPWGLAHFNRREDPAFVQTVSAYREYNNWPADISGDTTFSRKNSIYCTYTDHVGEKTVMFLSEPADAKIVVT